MQGSDSHQSGFIQRLNQANRRHQRDVASLSVCRSLKWIFLIMILAMGLDAIFHFGQGIRLAILIGFVTAGIAYGSWLGFLAWFQKHSPEQIARMLEARDETLGSKLMNILQLHHKAEEESNSELTRSLARRAVDDAAAEVDQRDLMTLARSPEMRLGRRTALISWGVFLTLLLALHPIAMPQFLRLIDPLGDHPPFSYTQLEIVSPAADGEEVIYDSGILVKAQFKGHAPREVFLTAEWTDGSQEPVRIPMIRSGDAGFLQEIQNVTGDLEIYAHTRNERSRSERRLVTVKLTPQMEEASVSVQPPDYTRLDKRDRPYRFKNLQVLKGSTLEFSLRSNRPLSHGTLIFQGSGEPVTHELTVGEANQILGGFAVEESGKLTFSMVDVDGIKSEKLWSAPLTVMHDLKPSVNVISPSADSFVVENFEVDVAVQASDDYGLKKLRYFEGINKEYGSPLDLELLSAETLIRDYTMSRTMTPRSIGARPGDTITLFASVQDTYPYEMQISQSRAVNLHVISEDQYNEYLRARHDIQDTANKYNELFSKYRELVDEQAELTEEAKDATPEELEELLAEQSELNQRLEKFADTMEDFVRDNPMYDLEKEFDEKLAEQAKHIRDSVAQNQEAMKEMAQAAANSMNPESFQKAAEEQLERLGGKLPKETEEKIAKALEDAAKMQELVKSLGLIQRLYQEQMDITTQTSAYRDGDLDEDDLAALKQLADRERTVGELLEAVKKKLREDAEAAKETYPKAAKSAMDLAAKIDQLNLQNLAEKTSQSMYVGAGERSALQSERLLQEMEKLFSECSACSGAGQGEFDQYLRLMHQMNAGQTFAQMMESMKMNLPGMQPSMGMGGGGMGLAGGMASGVQNGPQMGLLGGEAMTFGDAMMNEQRGKDSALVQTIAEDSESNLDIPKAEILSGMEIQTRESSVVSSQAILDQYNEIVDAYFQSLTQGESREE